MSFIYNFCNNCGKTGHVFHNCKKPITSIGTIVYKKDEKTGTIKYLLICLGKFVNKGKLEEVFLVVLQKN